MIPEPLKIELTPEAYEDLKRIAKKIKEIDEFKEIDEKVIIRLLAVTFVTFKLREKSVVQGLLEEIEREDSGKLPNPSFRTKLEKTTYWLGFIDGYNHAKNWIKNLIKKEFKEVGERMKPEPLTKEKIKRCVELMAIIQEEVGEAQKELNNIWFGKPESDWNKFKKEVSQIVPPLYELIKLLEENGIG